MDVKLKNNLLCKSGMYSFIDKSFLFWKIWGILRFFSLETHHSLLSHCVWVLVSGVLINKVWETEKIEDFIRWTGSTLQKWNHQLEKRLEGGKDTSRTTSLVASYKCPGSQRISQLPKCCGGECCATTPKGRSLLSICQNVKSKTSSLSHLQEEDLQSHRPRVCP